MTSLIETFQLFRTEILDSRNNATVKKDEEIRRMISVFNASSGEKSAESMIAANEAFKMYDALFSVTFKGETVETLTVDEMTEIVESSVTMTATCLSNLMSPAVPTIGDKYQRSVRIEMIAFIKMNRRHLAKIAKNFPELIAGNKVQWRLIDAAVRLM